eukprot:1861838-Alexandrium_andersonii.AAC.1
MSASLVGSEMCIRDRSSSHAKTSSSHCKSLRKHARRAAPTSIRFGPTPVSYTHLTLPTICSV